jgi:three-Cys-motif partner protein
MKKTLSDIVGRWTEVKLKIIQEYASAYALIMARQRHIKHFAYIDGFAGSGSLVAKATGTPIRGSPAIALHIRPPFSFYHFIDLDGKRAESLRAISGARCDVKVYEGDCNNILISEVFPECGYVDFRRALCLLDPYELNPNWNVVKTAAQMRSIEIFINFMISDANRNILWRNPDLVSPAQIERMNQFWGDDTWRKISYQKTRGLFGDMEEKSTNETISQAYKQRLLHVAGFKFVPDPIPMRNTKGTVLYYLYFASHKETGFKIARSIFNKYRKQGICYGR